jgi:hypothetical protein
VRSRVRDRQRFRLKAGAIFNSTSMCYAMSKCYPKKEAIANSPPQSKVFSIGAIRCERFSFLCTGNGSEASEGLVRLVSDVLHNPECPVGLTTKLFIKSGLHMTHVLCLIIFGCFVTSRPFDNVNGAEKEVRNRFGPSPFPSSVVSSRGGLTRRQSRWFL